MLTLVNYAAMYEYLGLFRLISSIRNSPSVSPTFLSLPPSLSFSSSPSPSLIHPSTHPSILILSQSKTPRHSTCSAQKAKVSYHFRSNRDFSTFIHSAIPSRLSRLVLIDRDSNWRLGEDNCIEQFVVKVEKRREKRQALYLVLQHNSRSIGPHPSCHSLPLEPKSDRTKALSVFQRRTIHWHDAFPSIRRCC